MKNDCGEKQKNLIEESLFPVLNALLIPFLKNSRVIILGLEHLANTNLKPLFQIYFRYWSRLLQILRVIHV